MRLFHQLVFEGYINGTAAIYTDNQFDALLGSADQLSLSGYAAQVGGTSPTVTVQVEQSFDQNRWQPRNGTAEINATALATSGETNFQGQDGDPASRATLAFARLKISLGGSSPAGQIRVWATGRDRGEG